MSIGSHYTVFTKDDFHYCVNIEHVREVIHTASLIPAPIKIPGFLGFFDFRQKLCPVLDIHSLGDIGKPIPEGPFNLVVVEVGSSIIAIQISKYVESLQLASQDALPIRESTIGGQRNLVDQVFRYKGKALNRIDLVYLLETIQVQMEGLLPVGLQSEQDTKQSLSEIEIELICFNIDQLQFGIPITDLVEVVEGYSVEPLFKTNSFLRGLINLRGQIIACVDLSEIIGLPRRKMEEKNQYILLQDNDRDLALCIDSISQKQKFLRSRIQNVEQILNEELSEYLLGIIETGTNRIFVISGPKIIASKYLVPYQE